jgi:gluconate 2-dehydrogenase gamma chain
MLHPQPGTKPDERMTDEQVQERLAARVMSRRRFLGSTAVGGLAAGAAAAAAASVPAASAGPPDTGHNGMSMQPAGQQSAAPPVGFEFFTPFQADIIVAAAARLIPTDDNGPGATEAGVVYFIDRQLSSDYGLSGRRYVDGPFMTGEPTQGDQSSLDMRDRYRLGIQGIEDYARQLFQQGFTACTPDQQDRILSDMQAGVPATFGSSSVQVMPSQAAATGTEAAMRVPSGATQVGAAAFFTLLLQHVIAGFFADPVHGGNRDMVGWQLIGFPGAQMSYAAHISNYGQPWTGGFKSLAEYQGPFSAQHG